MKRLLYSIQGKTLIANEEGKVEEVDVLIPADIPWSEENEARAKRESHNGEYTIEDDGQPEPETTDDVLNAMLGVM